MGIAIRFSLYGSEDTANGSDYIVRLIKAGFLPIFGSLDIYSSVYLTDTTLARDYTRESCLANAASIVIDDCPYRSGVIFTCIALVVYLVIMNLVFVNLLICYFK